MIATSKDQIEQWTPECLVNAPTPPVFLLKPLTHRHNRAFQNLLIENGIVFHDTESVRQEMFKALRSLWSPADQEREIARLEQAFAAMDMGEILPENEVMAIDELIQRVHEAWPKFGRMTAQNNRFHEDAPLIAASLAIEGWTGIETEYRRTGLSVPLETMDQLKIDLRDYEQRLVDSGANIAGLGQPGTAIMQLGIKGFSLLNLTGAERKNSDTGLPSGAIPNGSMADGPATTVSGKSAAKRSRSKKSSPARATSSI